MSVVFVTSGDCGVRGVRDEWSFVAFVTSGIRDEWWVIVVFVTSGDCVVSGVHDEC